MDNKYFKVARHLSNEEKKNETTSGLRISKSLSDTEKKEEPSKLKISSSLMNAVTNYENIEILDINEDLNKKPSEFFKKARNLSEEKTNSFFSAAKNLTEKKESKEDIKREIENFLMTIVSGEPLDNENELGTICGGGKMIVTYEELKQMESQNCYNFIKAQYINPNMIAIEYQKYQSKELSK